MILQYLDVGRDGEINAGKLRVGPGSWENILWDLAPSKSRTWRPGKLSLTTKLPQNVDHRESQKKVLVSRWGKYWLQLARWLACLMYVEG